MRITKSNQNFVPAICIRLSDLPKLLRGEITPSEASFKLFTHVKADIFTDGLGSSYIYVSDDFDDDYQLIKISDGKGTDNPNEVYLCAVTNITGEKTTTKILGDVAIHLKKLFPKNIDTCVKIAEHGTTATSEGMMHYEIIGAIYSGTPCPICELDDYRQKYKNYMDMV